MTQGLDVVLTLRTQALDKAAQRLQQQEQQLAQLQSQAKALEDYALDYQRQLSTEGVMGAQQRQIIAAYLNQVQQAIIGQYEKITQQTQQVADAKARWLEARLHAQAMEKLIEKRQHEAQQQQEKLEQQAADALSQVQLLAKQRANNEP